MFVSINQQILKDIIEVENCRCFGYLEVSWNRLGLHVDAWNGRFVTSGVGTALVWGFNRMN